MDKFNAHFPSDFSCRLSCSFFVIGVSLIFTMLCFSFSVSILQTLPLSFAQEPMGTMTNLISDQNNTIEFNTYENSNMEISLMYPSNFLVDESTSNETVKQLSFFPSYDPQGVYPQTYLSWFNVYIQTFYPPLIESSSQPAVNISSYLLDLANSIQQQNADVTIVETSTKEMLSGYPAYKLVTKSYSGNSTVNDVEIGTVVENKLYVLNYQVNVSNYENALPIANEMIDSFNIKTPKEDAISKSLQILSNSSEFATVKENVPLVLDLLSSLVENNNNNNSLSNSSTMLLNQLNKSSFKNLANLLIGAYMSSSSSPSSSPSSTVDSTTPLTDSNLSLATNTFSSSLANNFSIGSDSLDLQSFCTNPLLRELCSGNTVFQSLFSSPSP